MYFIIWIEWIIYSKSIQIALQTFLIPQLGLVWPINFKSINLSKLAIYADSMMRPTLTVDNRHDCIIFAFASEVYIFSQKEFHTKTKTHILSLIKDVARFYGATLNNFTSFSSLVNNDLVITVCGKLINVFIKFNNRLLTFKTSY